MVGLGWELLHAVSSGCVRVKFVSVCQKCSEDYDDFYTRVFCLWVNAGCNYTRSLTRISRTLWIHMLLTSVSLAATCFDSCSIFFQVYIYVLHQTGWVTAVGSPPVLYPSVQSDTPTASVRISREQTYAVSYWYSESRSACVWHRAEDPTRPQDQLGLHICHKTLIADLPPGNETQSMFKNNLSRHRCACVWIVYARLKSYLCMLQRLQCFIFKLHSLKVFIWNYWQH